MGPLTQGRAPAGGLAHHLPVVTPLAEPIVKLREALHLGSWNAGARKEQRSAFAGSVEVQDMVQAAAPEVSFSKRLSCRISVATEKLPCGDSDLLVPPVQSWVFHRLRQFGRQGSSAQPCYLTAILSLLSKGIFCLSWSLKAAQGSEPSPSNGNTPNWNSNSTPNPAQPIRQSKALPTRGNDSRSALELAS